MTLPIHAAATPHLPSFITPPDGTDLFFVVAIATVVGAVLGVGVIFLRLHTLPERMAHKTRKLQLEIVAVLGLLALFTHIHLFWVAGLLLALIEIPDFWNPLRRMARSLEKIAGETPESAVGEQPDEPSQPAQRGANLDRDGGPAHV